MRYIFVLLQGLVQAISDEFEFEGDWSGESIIMGEGVLKVLAKGTRSAF